VSQSPDQGKNNRLDLKNQAQGWKDGSTGQNRKEFDNLYVCTDIDYRLPFSCSRTFPPQILHNLLPPFSILSQLSSYLPPDFSWGLDAILHQLVLSCDRRPPDDAPVLDAQTELEFHQRNKFFFVNRSGLANQPVGLQLSYPLIFNRYGLKTVR
jgi:hypothetical protein